MEQINKPIVYIKEIKVMGLTMFIGVLNNIQITTPRWSRACVSYDLLVLARERKISI